MSKRKSEISSADEAALGTIGSETAPQDGSASETSDADATPAGKNGPAGTNTQQSGGGDAAEPELSGSEGPQGDVKVMDRDNAPTPEVSASASGNSMLADLKGLADALAMTGSKDFDDLVDMANVGRSLMERLGYHVTLEGPLKNWAPADDPAEVVGDLVNMIDELQGELDAVKGALAQARGDQSKEDERRIFLALGRINIDNEPVEPGGRVRINRTQHATLAAAGVVPKDWEAGL